MRETMQNIDIDNLISYSLYPYKEGLIIIPIL